MIDTARHWYPVTLILQHLDAMAYNKFNGVSVHVMHVCGVMSC
jgi:N-acetyl-beta-hexosaminidase